MVHSSYAAEAEQSSPVGPAGQETVPAHVKHEERSSWAKILGVGALIGASFLPNFRASAAEYAPPKPDMQPPAATQRADAEFVAQARAVQNVDDVVRVFNPATHVYVVNESSSGIPQHQIDQLARYLAHTDYYVVIASSTQGYSYNDATNGRYFSGTEAVETMLGQKLWNSKAFSQITDSRSGAPEKSGSLFVISMDTHGWWFSSSDLLEHHGVKDEQTWVNGFDNIAKPDFRAGRFADGVQRTVEAMEQRVDQSIKTEQARAEQIKQNAIVAVTSSTQLFKEYESKLADLNARFPGRSGDLFRPGDMQELQVRLEQGTKALQEKDFVAAGQFGSAVQTTLQARVRSLVNYPRAQRQISDLAGEVGAAGKHEFAFGARSEITAAERAVSQAKTQWEQGNSVYVSSLSHATEAVQAAKGTLADAVKTYNLDGEKIVDMNRALEQLGKSEQASGAARELKTASELVSEARGQWSEKSPAYPEVIAKAEAGVAEASRVVTSLESAALRTQLMWDGIFALLGLGALGAAGTGIVLNKKARGARDEAKEKFDRLKDALAQKEKGLDELKQLAGKALAKDGELYKFKPGSRSAQLAESARDALSRLDLFQVVATKEILERAQALIAKGGTFSEANFREAIATMTDKLVEFKKENRDNLRRAFDERKTGVAAMTASLDELAEFKKSMKEVDGEYKQLAATANSALQELLKARKELEPELERVNGQISKLKGQVSALMEYAKDDTLVPDLFTLPALGGELIPAAERSSAAISETGGEDPVTAYDRLETLGDDVTRAAVLVDGIAATRSTVIPDLRGKEKVLTDGGLVPAWIKRELAELSAKSNEHVSAIAHKMDSADEAALESYDPQPGFRSLVADTTRALEIDTERRGKASEELSTVTALVGATRRKIGPALGLDADKVLREDGADPDVALENARNKLDYCGRDISKGDLDGAVEFLRTFYEFTNNAKMIVGSTQAAFDTHAAVVAQRDATSAKLKAALPAHVKTLGAIVERYNPTVLELSKKDMAHEGADETVKNNIDETEEAIASGDADTLKARESFAAAQILEADHSLGNAEAHYGLANFRMQEIDEKKARLDATEAANKQLFAGLEKKTAALASAIENDYRVMESTVEQFENKGVASLEFAKKLQGVKKVDPFAIADKLEQCVSELAATERLVKHDQELHGEAKRSIADATARFKKAHELSAKVEQNDVPDSTATDRAQDKVESLGKELQQLSSKFSTVEKAQQRADWEVFDKDADRISAALESNAKTIAEEDEKGREACERVTGASASVRAASSWSGSYGITIDGDIGNDELRRAKEYRQRGEYAEAQRWAKKAEELADGAVSRAESEVRQERRRREEAEAARRAAEEAAAAARRAASSSHRSSSSSWSSGGGFSGGSHSSFGGGGGFSGGSHSSW